MPNPLNPFQNKDKKPLEPPPEPVDAGGALVATSRETSLPEAAGVLHGGVEALLVSDEREHLVTTTYRVTQVQADWLRDVAYRHSRKNGGKADASKVLRLILDEAMRASATKKR